MNVNFIAFSNVGNIIAGSIPEFSGTSDQLTLLVKREIYKHIEEKEEETFAILMSRDRNFQKECEIHGEDSEKIHNYLNSLIEEMKSIQMVEDDESED